MKPAFGSSAIDAAPNLDRTFCAAPYGDALRVAESFAADGKLSIRSKGIIMTKVLNLAKRFVADEDGAALIEYTVLLGTMLIATIAIIASVGNLVNAKWTTLANAVSP
jgi:pilus assembly protein Flp/PilA